MSNESEDSRYHEYRELKDCLRDVQNCNVAKWEIQIDIHHDRNYANKDIEALDRRIKESLAHVKDTYRIENQKQLEKRVEELQRELKLEFPEHQILKRQEEKTKSHHVAQRNRAIPARYVEAMKEKQEKQEQQEQEHSQPRHSQGQSY